MCRSPLVARDLVLYIPISADATRMKEDTTDAWARASWSRCDSFFLFVAVRGDVGQTNLFKCRVTLFCP